MESMANWGMTFVVVGFLWVIPLWLIVRAWVTYRRWRIATGAKSTFAGLSFLLLSCSMGQWFLILPLSMLFERSGRTVVSKDLVGVTNFVLCVVTMVLSAAIPKTLERITPTRRALIAASVYMMPMWIFLLMAH
jgi:hypothetical protein